MGLREKSSLTFPSKFMPSLCIRSKRVHVDARFGDRFLTLVRTFSFRFSISPVSDINLGPLVVGSRKLASFVIRNEGEFDFKYQVNRRMASLVKFLLTNMN